MQGNGQYANDSQGCIRMSGGYLRTRMFHQKRPTAGVTTFSVKGELAFCGS